MEKQNTKDSRSGLEESAVQQDILDGAPQKDTLKKHNLIPKLTAITNLF